MNGMIQKQIEMKDALIEQLRELLATAREQNRQLVATIAWMQNMEVNK